MQASSISNLWKAPECTNLQTDTSTASPPPNLVQRLTLHGRLHHLFIELNFFNLKLRLPSCLPTMLSYSALFFVFSNNHHILKELHNLLLYHVCCLLSISPPRMKSSIKTGISFFYIFFSCDSLYSSIWHIVDAQLKERTTEEFKLKGHAVFKEWT